MIDKNLDAYAARRSMQTAVVVFEPRLEAAEEQLPVVPRVVG